MSISNPVGTGSELTINSKRKEMEESLSKLKKAQKKPRIYLTLAQREQVYNEKKAGVDEMVLAAKFNVDPSTIYRIIEKKEKSLPESKNPENKVIKSKHQHLPDPQKEEILLEIQTGKPLVLISKDTGVNTRTLKRLKNKMKPEIQARQSKHQHLPDPQKEEILLEIQTGKPLVRISEETGVTTRTLKRLKNILKKDQDAVANKIWGPSNG